MDKEYLDQISGKIDHVLRDLYHKNVNPPDLYHTSPTYTSPTRPQLQPLQPQPLQPLQHPLPQPLQSHPLQQQPRIHYAPLYDNNNTNSDGTNIGMWLIVGVIIGIMVCVGCFYFFNLEGATPVECNSITMTPHSLSQQSNSGELGSHPEDVLNNNNSNENNNFGFP